MDNLPSVAVCIPTFNQAQYLRKSVLSACHQTHKNVEVWVSDNSSTDETPTIMVDLCQEFSQIRYYRQSKNLGAVGNQNWVLQQPETDFIVRLDSDDIITPDYVETLITSINKYPDAGFAHSAVQEIGEFGEKLNIRRCLWRQEFQNPEECLLDLAADARFCPTIMYKSSALKKVRFYDERVSYAVDYDLSVRLADAGYGNVYVDTTLVYFRLWSGLNNLRLKRKVTHLQDLVFIYNKVLLPAFQRRGMSTQIINRCRSKTALIHSIYCFSPNVNTVERGELVDLLRKLSDAPRLRVRLWLLGVGLYPLFIRWEKIDSKLKIYVKHLLLKYSKISL